MKKDSANTERIDAELGKYREYVVLGNRRQSEVASSKEGVLSAATIGHFSIFWKSTDTYITEKHRQDHLNCISHYTIYQRERAPAHQREKEKEKERDTILYDDRLYIVLKQYNWADHG